MPGPEVLQRGGTQSGPLNRRPPDPLGVQKMSKPDIYLDPQRSQYGHVGFIQPLPVLSALKRGDIWWSILRPQYDTIWPVDHGPDLGSRWSKRGCN